MERLSGVSSSSLFVRGPFMTGHIRPGVPYVVSLLSCSSWSFAEVWRISRHDVSTSHMSAKGGPDGFMEALKLDQAWLVCEGPDKN